MQNDKLIVRCFNKREQALLCGALNRIGFSVTGTEQAGKDGVAVRIDVIKRTAKASGFRKDAFSDGARFCSVTEFLHLARLGFPAGTRFPFFHVPHDGDSFPPELLASVCVPPETFRKHHEKMRDTGAAELIPEAYRCLPMTERFLVSRLLCDPERFIGDGEIMERYGMGFCYEKAYDGTVIKNVTEDLKEKTLRYYLEHHERVDEKCRTHPKVLLFDVHSYSDEIVPADFLLPGRETPDVCIGTDPVLTPPWLYATVKTRFEKAGFSTAENYPYSGCLIPNTVMAGNGDCISVMLEFHKRIYLDAAGKPDEKKTSRIRKVIEKIVADCIGRENEPAGVSSVPRNNRLSEASGPASASVLSR